MRSGLSLFVIAIVSTGAAHSGESAGCAQIEDDARRLACYDRSAGDASSAEREESESPDSPIVDSQSGTGELPRDEQAAEGEFGLPASRTSAEELDEIHAVVTGIDTLRSNRRQFTLDNGQIWLEDSATTQPRLEAGDTVRIERGAFGSYRLFGDGKISTRVSRQR